ncbi:hypothetical protein ACQPXH_16115 [Nocardia sp. CA-135953]
MRDDPDAAAGWMAHELGIEQPQLDAELAAPWADLTALTSEKSVAHP